MSDPVQYKKEDGLAILRLDSPGNRNALSFELLESLSEGLTQVANDPQVKIAVLIASGPAFSAGMDLKNVHLDQVSEATRFAALLTQVYGELLRLPIPLFCGVDGKVMGGAVGIVLAADLVFAGPGAEFSFPEVRIGLVPALVSVVAKRRIHPARLSGLALTGAAVDAATAVQLGLADALLEQSATGDILNYAQNLIVENSNEAMRRTKKFLTAGSLTDLEEDFALASQEFQTAVDTPAARHGLGSFREKHPIVWNEGSEEPQ